MGNGLFRLPQQQHFSMKNQTALLRKVLCYQWRIQGFNIKTQIYHRFQRVFQTRIAYRLFLFFFLPCEFTLRDHSHRTKVKTSANNDIYISSLGVKKPLSYSSNCPGYITGKYATYLQYIAWIKKKGQATTEISSIEYLVLRPAQMYKSYSKLRSNGREKVTLGKIKIHCVCTYKTVVKH